MTLPYILEEQSVLRKENSTTTITEVIADTKAWLEELQAAETVLDKFYYANIYDAETKKKYLVYSDKAVEYFELSSYVTEFPTICTPVQIGDMSKYIGEWAEGMSVDLGYMVTVGNIFYLSKIDNNTTTPPNGDTWVELDLYSKVNSNAGFNQINSMTQLTQEEYDSITPNPNTLYIIVG